MTDVAELAHDLRAEQDALDLVVADLPNDQWQRATPSPGWTVADQIAHLTYFDGTATLAITDAAAFQASLHDLLSAGERMDEITLNRGLAPSERLAAWRANRRTLAGATTTLQDGQRVPWYGPSMSAKSFLTARLMECWAHGQDVVDALGASRPPTDRLRHVAQLGVITRGWTYLNRGLEPPAGEVSVQLTAPSGDRWTWGPDDALDAVRGPALDFCLVVTQRRHVDDTELEITGDMAREWLEMAQAYAGPPTDPPAARSGR